MSVSSPFQRYCSQLFCCQEETIPHSIIFDGPEEDEDFFSGLFMKKILWFHGFTKTNCFFCGSHCGNSDVFIQC